jgi:hypothetical protein
MLATLMSGFENCSHEQIRAALPYLNAEEKSDLAEALEAKERDELDARCGLVKLERRGNTLMSDATVGCLYWLQNITLSEDDHWLAKKTAPKAPFPRKEYFRHVLGAMQFPVVYPSGLCQQLYIAKSREMMTSYLACGYVSWLCQWHPNLFCVLQSQQEAKAEELIRYTKILYDNQPEWMKEKHPLLRDNALVREYQNGSRIVGLPKGENQVRSLHPFLYLADEAAFLEEFRECVAAVQPVAKQIIAISTANPGPFGDVCSTHEVHSAPSFAPSPPRPDPIPPEETEPIKPELTHDELCQQILTRDPKKEAWARDRTPEAQQEKYEQWKRTQRD